ncbi:MAG: folate-binding protein YgfZ [Gammaproteobacteria bacterium]|nr:folate-binding protein YgfZ [Gammaproteobacteria bacterium]
MDQRDWGRVSVTGEDAMQLLQGQLTQDVTLAGPAHAPMAAWCNPQGRVLSVSRLLSNDPAQVELLMPAALTAEVARRLGMYVLRSRAKVVDAGGGWRSVLVTEDQARNRDIDIGNAPGSALHAQQCWWIRLPGNTGAVEVNGPAEAVEALALPADNLRTRPQCGLPIVLPETQGSFIPQMLNLDLIGAVSFRKGCYSGQEIVARTQNLGRIKRRMALYAGDSTPLPSPGEKLLHDGQAAAEVVDAAGKLVLAVVNLSHAQLTLTSTAGVMLAPLPMPYEVPELPAS